MLQVRQAIAEALGIKKLSLVKLVKRLGSDRLMTSVGDSERLSQKSVSDVEKIWSSNMDDQLGSGLVGYNPKEYPIYRL